MRIGALSTLLLRIIIWSVAGIAAILLLWFAANRLFDERPDPRREAFLTSAEGVVPDAENLAIGIAGLGAQERSDLFPERRRQVLDHALSRSGLGCEERQTLAQICGLGDLLRQAITPRPGVHWRGRYAVRPKGEA
jgi:hypothetical protein